MVSIWVLENLLLKDGTTLQASVIVLYLGPMEWKRNWGGNAQMWMSHSVAGKVVVLRLQFSAIKHYDVHRQWYHIAFVRERNFENVL